MTTTLDSDVDMCSLAELKIHTKRKNYWWKYEHISEERASNTDVSICFYLFQVYRIYTVCACGWCYNRTIVKFPPTDKKKYAVERNARSLFVKLLIELNFIFRKWQTHPNVIFNQNDSRYESIFQAIFKFWDCCIICDLILEKRFYVFKDVIHIITSWKFVNKQIE